MKRERQPCVYLLASARNGTLYLGVTSDLIARIHQHRTGTFEGFSKLHEIHQLVWFEQHEMMESAITREKQLKGWRRAWKIELIEAANPRWLDLAVQFGFAAL
jgi:putative endonuclease